MSNLSEQIAEAERMQRWGYANTLRRQAGEETPQVAEPILEASAPDQEPAPAVEQPAEPPAEE